MRCSSTSAVAGTGKSCHHCKSRKSDPDIVHCNHAHEKKTARSAAEMRPCHKKFCLTCIHKYYPLDEPHVMAGEAAIHDWTCPCCRNCCTCAGCKRSEVAKSQDAAAAESGASSSKFHKLPLPKLTVPAAAAAAAAAAASAAAAIAKATLAAAAVRPSSAGGSAAVRPSSAGGSGSKSTGRSRSKRPRPSSRLGLEVDDDDDDDDHPAGGGSGDRAAKSSSPVPVTSPAWRVARVVAVGSLVSAAGAALSHLATCAWAVSAPNWRTDPMHAMAAVHGTAAGGAPGAHSSMPTMPPAPPPPNEGQLLRLLVQVWERRGPTCLRVVACVWGLGLLVAVGDLVGWPHLL